MTIFVDTGVFYAHHDADAARHEIATTALNTLLSSPEYGRILTSDYVYDETVTLTQHRTGSTTVARTVGQRIRGDGYPDAIELLYRRYKATAPRLDPGVSSRLATVV